MPAFAPVDRPLFVDWESGIGAGLVGMAGALVGLVLEGRLFVLGGRDEVKPKKSETVTELGTAMDVRVDEITTTAVAIEVDVATDAATAVD
jgi:hypothetical protein